MKSLALSVVIATFVFYTLAGWRATTALGSEANADEGTAVGDGITEGVSAATIQAATAYDIKDIFPKAVSLSVTRNGHTAADKWNLLSVTTTGVAIYRSLVTNAGRQFICDVNFYIVDLRKLEFGAEKRECKISHRTIPGRFDPIDTKCDYLEGTLHADGFQSQMWCNTDTTDVRATVEAVYGVD